MLKARRAGQRGRRPRTGRRSPANAARSDRLFAIVAILAFLASCVAPALADSLLTGAIRDEDGVAVRSARVTAFDGSGRVVGRDIAVDDGTFALTSSGPVASVGIDCDFCQPMRQSVGASDEPLVVIVHRYAAVMRTVPSASDIRALPYRSIADVASLLPYTVVRAGRVSDRGLDVYGAQRIDGLPFYAPSDGDNYSRLVPARGLAGFDASSPVAAPLYGGYASAGLYDVRLHDADTATSRIDAGDGFDIVARASGASADALYADSNDDGERRAAGALNLRLPVAGGRLTVDALEMADDVSHAAGAGLVYATESRRYGSSVALRATQNDGGSLVTFDADVRNRGPLQLEFGLRATRATAPLGDGTSGVQTDAAVYAAASRQSGALSTVGIVAVDRGGNFGSYGDVAAQALVASLANDLRLSARWTVHSGFVSNLRIPTFAESATALPGAFSGDRSTLFEQSLGYTDLRRLRARAVAYTQRTAGASATHVNGVGVDLGWQIAPEWALAAWLLRANQQQAYGYVPSSSTYTIAAIAAQPLTRQLVWLTYGRGVRADLLLRGGAPEADLRVPFSGGFALAFGTATSNGRRITTLGLTSR